jgi:hypothetical protein
LFCIGRTIILIAKRMTSFALEEHTSSANGCPSVNWGPGIFIVSLIQILAEGLFEVPSRSVSRTADACGGPREPGYRYYCGDTPAFSIILRITGSSA